MSYIGLELNATLARAVHGFEDELPRGLPLEPPRLELSMVVMRDGRQPQAGQAGLRMCRQQPHRVWQHFLPALGLAAREAAHLTRHYPPEETLQATMAVLQHLAQHCRRGQGVVLALPAYLGNEQVKLLRGLARQCGLPLLGSLSTPLTAALASYIARPWVGSALVLDVDDHALTISRVEIAAGRVQQWETVPVVALGLKTWKERLLKALADCCVRQSRRDPRASPQAEQSMYESLDAVLEACGQGRTVQLGLQAAQWYQNLLVLPEHVLAFCRQLVRQTVGAVQTTWQSTSADVPPRRLLLTAAVARLPGLLPALSEAVAAWLPPEPIRITRIPSDDFGDDLLPDEVTGAGGVEVLPVDAIARAGHSLATAWHHGSLNNGHLAQAPLPVLQLSV